MNLARFASAAAALAATLALAQQPQPDAPQAQAEVAAFIVLEPGVAGYRGFEKAVIEDYVKSADGDAQALERLREACEAAVAADEQNAEALAWRGAARMFDAGAASDDGNFMAAMNHVNGALSDLKRARELEPANPGVRIIAAQTLLALAQNHPIEQMAQNYAKQGIEDANAGLKALYPNWKEQSPELKGRIILGVAQAWDRLGDSTRARDWFNRVLGAVPGTAWAEQAQAWIDAADKKASSF